MGIYYINIFILFHFMFDNFIIFFNFILSIGNFGHFMVGRVRFVEEHVLFIIYLNIPIDVIY